MEEEVAVDINGQEEILKVVQGNQEKVQERTRSRLQSQAQSESFQARDMVWRKHIRSRQ